MLDDQSVHVMVTSPPYWNLRDYGGLDGQLGREKVHDCLGWADGDECGECFVCHTLAWMRRVRRVLRDDGTAWIVIGDTFGARGNLLGTPARLHLALQADGWIVRQDVIWAKGLSFRVKTGGDDWAGAVMPDSVKGTRWERHRIKVKDDQSQGNGKQGEVGSRIYTGFNERYHEGRGPQYIDCPGCPKCDPHGGYVLKRGSWRPTCGHEHVLMLAKRPGYYCDHVAVQEEGVYPAGTRAAKGGAERASQDGVSARPEEYATYSGTRNPRDVWAIGTRPYPGSHFATYPPDLVRPIIQVATSERGVCPACGAPWAREITSEPEPAQYSQSQTQGYAKAQGGRDNPGLGVGSWRMTHPEIAKGWRPTCTCDAGDPVASTVLDPFAGSGTTGLVALGLGRNYIGIDLDPASEGLHRERLAPFSGGMLAVEPVFERVS